MIRLALIAGALAISLCGCANINPGQIAEKGDTDASLAYATVATLANAYETRPGADVPKAEALKLKAWKALTLERQIYFATGKVDLTALNAFVLAAKNLGN